jgi:hypothetical protein
MNNNAYDCSCLPSMPSSRWIAPHPAGPCNIYPWLAWLAAEGPDKVLLITGGFFFATLATATVSLRSRARLVCHFANAYSVLMLCRAVLYTVTALPSPSPLCRGIVRFEDLPREGWFLAPIYCQDCMFSGHALMTTLACLFMDATLQSSDVTWRHVVLRGCVALWGTFAMLWSVILRDHYTVDVLVAALVALLYFKAIEPRVLKELGRHESATVLQAIAARTSVSTTRRITESSSRKST